MSSWYSSLLISWRDSQDFDYPALHDASWS